MFSSNCCFLTCIQVSQEADQVVWYSHLFQNFPQYIVIHTVKGFGIVNNRYTEYIMQNTGLNEAQAGVKMARRNINNLSYADDTILRQKVKRN